ncbi:helix-turn-helix domain-containing protein [Bradyrhizobium japonicum]|nr:helix-turn-helix domain-containing protein [Bradyrhizobium japonicum]
MKVTVYTVDHYRRMLSVQPHALRPLDGSATILRCNRDQEIPYRPETAGHWCYLITGAVRRSTIRPDGRRQILELMLPRDCFFVSDDQGGETVEAIVEPTVLASYSAERVDLLADRDRELARELRAIMSQSLRRTRDQLIVLGGVTAVEKVGWFLLTLEKRASDQKGQVDLPITRYDIAEYLSVSVETVCRAITDLQQRGIIALVGTRKIKIIDRTALEERGGTKPQGGKLGLIAA